jgi:hypothetical protein
MPAPESVKNLVERFRDNLESYQSARFNEAQLRQEFLNPFFKALGWDVYNEQGHAEAYKDVIHEDAIKIGTESKAPDYCFRIGGRRMFFLEAKKPAVNVGQDVNAAYQLRRYAWSAKLPLSILSDFEELAVYDCRIKPDKTDKPSVARTMFLTFEDYLEKWDNIAGIFSREAVLKGSFDKYAEGTKLKRGTAEVDAAFLSEIESWRESLARNFALRNKDLSQRDLNFAVQRTIDRIVFLRMCEDRGIEKYGQLAGMANGEHVYRRLCQLFDRADERYNSGLFHFQVEKGRAEPPDELTQSLALDDKPLKEILQGLYFPDSPYEFSVLPAEILGQVYEQFLGKVIRLTAGHQAKIEDKPEVKKAGGVYYTPAYIVDYIVKNTVGKLVEKKTPKDVAKLRVLDPACGSGSFLVGAYQFLLDWHRDWYLTDGPSTHKKQIYQGRGGQWFLTTAEKKRILLSNIYGVDIDTQAVEVTKLSLLLKVLENENLENLENQLRLLHERALPDLGDNIKCGNSLIGPDFYDGRQLSLLDEDERLRINSFDWKQEFPAILKGKSSGFDAVIGNPPYVSAMLLSEIMHPDVKHYWKSRFVCARGAYDIYILFVEQAVRLARDDGLVSFIIPNKFLAAEYALDFRAWVLASTQFKSLLDLSRVKVWRAAVYPVVPLLEKRPPDTSVDLVVLGPSQESSTYRELARVPVGTLRAVPDNLWSFITQPGSAILLKCLSASQPLDKLAEVCGATTVAEGAEYPAIVRGKTKQAIGTDESRFIVSGSVFRYHTTWHSESVQFTGEKYQQPVIALRSPMPTRRIEQARSRKIIICKVALTPRAFPDLSGEFAGAYTTYILNSSVDLVYLTALINSRLMAFLYRRLYDALAMGGGYLRFQPPQVRRLPIRVPSTTKQTEKKRFDRVVTLSTTMLDLHERLGKLKASHEKTAIQRQIDATDRQIDQLVYDLYGLSDDEIRLVEEGTAK